MNTRRFALRSILVVALLLLWGCGGGGGAEEGADPGPADLGGADGARLDSGSDHGAADPGSGSDPGPGNQVDPEAFKILYTYQERFESCEPEGDPLVRDSDLHIIWPDGTHGLSVTSLSLKTEQDRNCQGGCFTDEKMRWIAIADKVNLDGTFDLVLGRFTPTLEAKVIKGFDLRGVVDFEFGGDFFFFSKLEGQAAGGPGGKYYALSRFDLQKLGQPAPLLPGFPPEPERADSTYQGHFRADPTGAQIVLLNPTIGSQQVFRWSEKSLLQEVHKICPEEIGGKCASQGSVYRDMDPVAIDSEGTVLVAAFRNGDALTVFLWDLTVPTPQLRFSNLLTVPGGVDFISAACLNTTEVFPWVKVKQLALTPDAKEAVLLVQNDCPNVLAAGKERTDLIAIPLAAIGDGTPIEKADIRNLTRNPDGMRSDNVIIDGFDLAPDGSAAVFTATPMIDLDGTRLKDKDQRTLNDRELYVIPLDGGRPQQLTNDLCFKARGASAVVPVGTPPEWR